MKVLFVLLLCVVLFGCVSKERFDQREAPKIEWKLDCPELICLYGLLEQHLPDDCQKLGVPVPRVLIHLEPSPWSLVEVTPNGDWLVSVLMGFYSIEDATVHLWLFLPLEPVAPGEAQDCHRVSDEEMLRTLRHELLHHQDQILGAEHKAGHGEAFEDRLKKLGW